MNSNGTPKLQIKPFLRWAGGKQLLARKLLNFLPVDFDDQKHTYFEPFLGAGTMLLKLAPKRAEVSDLNEHLINLFRTIKTNPSELSRQCKLHEQKNNEKYYYRIRELFNKDSETGSVKQASRFLYLNRSCYNGIFRVNQKGMYNVPYGKKPRLLIPTFEQLKQLSNRFKEIRFSVCSFETIYNRIKRNDLVYLDPPYPPLNGTSYFTHYTKERFGVEDQKKVADFANCIKKKGAHVMITNADTQYVRTLYRGWLMRKIQSRRFITCKAERHSVGELVITSYQIGVNNE